MTWNIITDYNEQTIKDILYSFSNIIDYNYVKIKIISCVYKELTYDLNQTMFLPPASITHKFCETIQTFFMNSYSFMTGLYFNCKKNDTRVQRKIGFREVNKFLLSHGIIHYPMIWSNGFEMYNFTTFRFESIEILEEIINSDLFLNNFFILSSKTQEDCSCVFEKLTSYPTIPNNLFDLKKRIIDYSLNANNEIILFVPNYEFLAYHSIQIKTSPSKKNSHWR